MNRKAFVWMVVGVGLVGALALGYWIGRRDVLIQEFKMCQASMLTLTCWETNHPPELKDYVKARYYYLANRIPPSWLGDPQDYGQVNTNISDVAVFKGPSSGQAEYEEFMRHFPLARRMP